MTMTGMAAEDLVSFTPQRLVLHELIVRITADIAVEEGDAEEVFGENFRHIARRILNAYLQPRAGLFDKCLDELRERAEHEVVAILAAARPPVPVRPPRGLRGLFARKPPAVREETGAAAADADHRFVARLKASGLAAHDPFERALYKSAYRVLGAVVAHRGMLAHDVPLLARLVVRHLCNSYGSQLLGEAIAPLVAQAIATEGYRPVVNRAAPILISLKGASAAGKSSLRPMIKRLMQDTGVEGDGYATISPDVWRRLLLDYDTLGPAYKYAGHFTSREVMVIDAKLDRYIRDKAKRTHSIPHLLVDRFRFDSFSTREIGRVLHDTYTRYVTTIHMYFVVTPPEETVERGWLRGLERGRYKAVEDFLAHCIEGYAGMPRVLFKWLAYRHIDYRYHFLDNRVPKGSFPTVIAEGTRERMTIRDPVGMIDIARYAQINLYAANSAEVYAPPASRSVAGNTGFLRECLRRIPQVCFVARSCQGLQSYLEFRNGNAHLLDARLFATVADDERVAAIMREIVPELRPHGPADGAEERA